MQLFQSQKKTSEFFTAPGLRGWRVKKEISLRRFAKLLGFSPAYISDIERGNRKASQHFVKRFKEVFGKNSR
jgi:predicted transcriptional regulator